LKRGKKNLRRNQVTLVVNYDAPSNTEDYVHRIGRTAGGAQMSFFWGHGLKGVGKMVIQP
jgi:superfamily II DNA/RNA helicase